MNSKDRVFMALEYQEPDRVPLLEWEIHPDVIEAISPGSTYEDFVEEFDVDAVSAYEDIKYRDLSPTEKIDHWGIIRDFSKKTSLFWPMPLEGPIKSEKDLEKYNPPDPHDPRKLATLRRLVKRFKGEKAIAFCVFDSFQWPAFLRDIENFLMDYVRNPEFAKKVVEITTNYYVELTKHAVDEGADIIWSGDDYCGKSGPLMSPSHFEEFVLPGMVKVMKAAKEKGAYYIKHCDGYLWPILDKMVNAGIDALNPIQPDAGMDIGEVKKVYGDKICLIGNIECSHLLTFGSPNKVIKAVKECILQAAPGGGYILSSSNCIHKSVKPENFLAMIRATKKYGRYPRKIY